MPDWTLARTNFIALCILASLISSASATNFSPSATHMFRELHRQPNDLARYMYLLKTTPTLPLGDQQLGLQMFAVVECELGLYNEALRDFPLKSHIVADDHLPTSADWTSVDAVKVITKLAAGRRLVMVNESHHDAHTRELTLALLPRLRALGFNYFAAEALTENDQRLMQRGYPVETSGTEYLHEPNYGDIVRTAIRLGFKVISYDVDTISQNDRESGQAKNLYAKTFATDPRAKVFVHAGYAHIDKAKGRLGNAQPMAVYLQQLSGIEPLAIDQTRFREQVPTEHDAYQRLITEFRHAGPVVLINRVTSKPWAADPGQYDANVILPPAADGVVESGFAPAMSNVRASDRDHLMLRDPVVRQRPRWLTRRSGRTAWAISATMCGTTFPCVIEAIHVEESDDAIAADRYAFMQGDSVSRLYLPAGRYRLRARNSAGKTLREQVIAIGDH